MKLAGLVLAATAGLWVAYLVPHWLRYRQQLLESRADDRFSEQLRVVRVAGHAQRPVGRPARPAQVLLHPQGARGRGGTVDRPHSATDRAAADAVRRTAADRARQVHLRAVRRARARRRAALAAALLLLTVAGWAGVALTQLALTVAVVPTVGLLTVLVLGRRAVVTARGFESAHRAVPIRTAAPAPATVRPTEVTGPIPSDRQVRKQPSPATVARPSRAAMAIGHAVRPSDADTEIIEPVVVDVLTPSRPEPEAVQVPEQRSRDEASWVPVPVPVPAYTLKPAVRRAAPPPLVLDQATSADGAPEAEQDSAVEGPPSLDLDAVLARRRAAGE